MIHKIILLTTSSVAWPKGLLKRRLYDDIYRKNLVQPMTSKLHDRKLN